VAKVYMDVTIIDAELDVTYRSYKAHRGARDSFMGRPGAGAQLEPDEPAGIEIESIKLFGHEVEVSEKDLENIEEKILAEMEGKDE
jgi:hypothetical protein